MINYAVHLTPPCPSLQFMCIWGRLLFVSTCIWFESSLDKRSKFIIIIHHVSGSNSKISYEKANKDDPKKRKPDISLAKSVLNWQPKIKMRDGLLKTIDYFKQELKKNDRQWSFTRKDYGIV